jgi:signal peptidase I
MLSQIFKMNKYGFSSLAALLCLASLTCRSDDLNLSPESCILSHEGPIQTYVVTGVSMEPQIHRMESVSVDTSYFANRSPSRGDIVVFRNTKKKEQILVKRIIGLPKERIEFKNGEIYISGRKLRKVAIPQARCEVIESKSEIASLATNLLCFEETLDTIKFVVLNHERALYEQPETKEIWVDNYFLLGDNREHSLDSRVLGLIPRENIIGKVIEPKP